jgi:hypothetical protein
VEWVIINYGSTDGLTAFIEPALARCSMRITYLSFDAPRPWHSSIAKNWAHAAAAGDILVNLDCDNLIGDAAEVVKRYFDQGCRLLHLWSGVFSDGTYGRIALRKQLFHHLGGYDESFHPMGFQDSDLIHRAVALGHSALHYRSSSRLAIRNSKEDSIRNCKTKDLAWRDYNDINRALSRKNIAAGRLVANGGRIDMPPPDRVIKGRVN